MQGKVALIRNECLMDGPLDIQLYYWHVLLWEMPINGGKTCVIFNPTSQKQNIVWNYFLYKDNYRTSILSIGSIMNIFQIVLLLSCFVIPIILNDDDDSNY